MKKEKCMVFKGENYDARLTNKEIAVIIRKFLKKFKNIKWSVRSTRYDIQISLMEASFKPFKEIEDLDTRNIERQYSINTTIEDWYQRHIKNHSLNNYYIEEDLLLTDESKKMFEEIKNFVNSYKLDDSDAMADYFNYNFFLNLSIGKWDKPFKLTSS